MVALSHTRTMVIGRTDGARRLLAGLQRRGVSGLIIDDAAGLVELRRDLLVHRGSVLLCVELNPRTRGRFGRVLRLLLADRSGFAADVRVIGIHHGQLTGEHIALGCDAYARSPQNVMRCCAAFERQQAHQGGSHRRGVVGGPNRRLLREPAVAQVDTRRRLTEEQSVVFSRAGRPARGLASRPRLQ